MAHTPAGAKMTELIIETFRLNGALISAGDQLVGDLDLTSARWQVLGALSERARPVAEIARRMGLARQSVQRIANCLVDDGFLETSENPAHRRAKLYRLTALGEKVMAEVGMRQADWVNRVAENIEVQQLETALSLLRQLNQRLG